MFFLLWLVLWWFTYRWLKKLFEKGESNEVPWGTCEHGYGPSQWCPDCCAHWTA